MLLSSLLKRQSVWFIVEPMMSEDLSNNLLSDYKEKLLKAIGHLEYSYKKVQNIKEIHYSALSLSIMYRIQSCLLILVAGIKQEYITGTAAHIYLMTDVFQGHINTRKNGQTNGTTGHLLKTSKQGQCRFSLMDC